MKTGIVLAIGALLALHDGSAAAQAPSPQDADGDTLELTMTLLPEGATQPDAVTKVIELPPAAANGEEESGADAAQGLDRANEARERRNDGLGRAAEAREEGRAFGREMREQAQENRENNGRAEPPEPPGRPDLPGGVNPGGPPGTP